MRSAPSRRPAATSSSRGRCRARTWGPRTQGLSLNAPAGTVYVSGTLSTAGASAATAGDGHAGGAITITALNIVITGSVTSAGGNGVSAGGSGGAITLTSAGGIAASGGIDSLGGEARGDGAATGGNGGAIRLTAGGDVLIARARLHGGGGKSANGQAAGGAGAALTVDADGALRVTGILDARGGPAIAAGAGTAGTAGSISIGQTAPPSRIEMGVALALDGGAGPDAGGNGGALAFEARGGDLRCAGSMDVSGGSSVTRPGNAGSINGIVGPDAGGFSLSGKITGNGGDGQPGGSASGGVGGLLRIQITSLNGGYNIEGSGEFQFDGGASSGSGTAGAGGDMELVCMDGNSALSGKLLARGGEAPDAGGHGGGGGILHIWTDSNYNGVGGNFMIQPSGLIDVSGGAGSIGGDARNNGGEGVALFPEHQEQLSVLIDTETIQGNSQDGVVDNQGLIVSRGGVHGGTGGDVMFHGRRDHRRGLHGVRTGSDGGRRGRATRRLRGGVRPPHPRVMQAIGAAGRAAARPVASRSNAERPSPSENPEPENLPSASTCAERRPAVAGRLHPARCLATGGGSPTTKPKAAGRHKPSGRPARHASRREETRRSRIARARGATAR